MTFRLPLRRHVCAGLAAAILVGLGAAAAGDATALGRGEHESLRLRLVNHPGGPIEVSADGGLTWRLLGRVTRSANTVSRAGYTAASWAADSAVAATAVNAIHIKVTQDPQRQRAVIFSVVPGGRLIGAASREPSSAIETDIAGGTSVFGAGLGPYVNSPVVLETCGGEKPLPPDYVPREGDTLVIRRLEPEQQPLYAIFENRPAGAVLLDYGAQPLRVGRVDHPVTGIGRFEGTLYAAPGRVRANHPGVIDVSTSPLGMIGGFQIIPRQHAASPEMRTANPAQWMVIGPDAADARDWAGTPPFFAGCIVPSYRPDDLTGDHTDWFDRVLSRFLVQVSYDGLTWRPMPRIAFTDRTGRDTAQRSNRGQRGLWLIPAQANPRLPMSPAERAQAEQALADVRAIRFVFPQGLFWPQDANDPVFRPSVPRPEEPVKDEQ